MMEELCRLLVKINVRTSTSEFDGEYGVVPCLKHDRRKFGVFDFRKAFGIFDLCDVLAFRLEIVKYGRKLTSLPFR